LSWNSCQRAAPVYVNADCRPVRILDEDGADALAAGLDIDA